jgi:phage terminase Nu1 subunit (DNA packaging protein)
MTKLLTGQQVGLLAGISPSAVSKLKSTEDPLHRRAGGYDPVEVGRWLYRRALGSVGKGAADGLLLDLSREQALLARARREAIEFEQAIRRGEYLAAADVGRGWATICRVARDRILGVPARAASQTVGMDNEREIERLWTRELREALIALADNPPKANGEALSE